MRSLVERAPLSSGRTCYKKFLDGEVITYKDAVRAKCFECSGGYIDGKVDCKMKDCALYYFYPYKEDKVPC